MSPNEDAAGCSVNGLRQTRGTAGNQVRRSISKAKIMWLDAEFSGGRGRNSRGKTLPTAIKEAEKMLADVEEGQVGIYGAYAIGPCHGYVIKHGGRVRFDPWKDN